MRNPCDNPKFADAPFCAGPSDPSRANLPYADAMTGCNSHDDTGYLDVALSEGSHVVVINGDVVEEVTLTREDVSEAFGLRPYNYGPLPEGPGEVKITSTFDGVTDTAGGTYLIDCIEEVEAAAEDPTPAPTLPAAGVDSLALVLAALLAVAAGTVLRRVGR